MIDWSRVTTLREEVGEEDFDEVVELFLEEVDDTVARLAEAPDLTTLGEDLHFLKGSATNLGFIQFSELCASGEAVCAQGNPSSVDLAQLVDSYRGSRGVFLQDLSRARTG